MQGVHSSMEKCNEIIDFQQEVRQTVRKMVGFREPTAPELASGRECNWIPTTSSAPAHVETTGGMQGQILVHHVAPAYDQTSLFQSE
eukprot:9948445-Ditylum_brightwellii.AAC.1